jgi:speckle-type POZ protein
VSAYVALLSTNNHDIKVSILDVTGSAPPCTLAGTHEFESSSSCGDHKFKRRSELSPYLHDDRLTIECAITVVEDDAKSSLPDVVPPSDIVQHLGKLLQQKENTDVTFIVGGQAFPAHKTVLAMRSPVFKDELYGTTTEKDTNLIIAIDDMQPVVFEALLHFIYTDSLPAPIDNLGICLSRPIGMQWKG